MSACDPSRRPGAPARVVRRQGPWRARRPELASRPVLVTGASGFLGRRLVEALLDEGRPVHAWCRNPASLASFADRLAGLHCGDLTETGGYRDLLGPETSVFHLAASRAHVYDGANHHRVNVEATERLARAALTAGVRRFVHVSTALVYGPSWGEPRRETDRYDREWARHDAYAGSKIEAAERLRRLAGAGLSLIIVSPTIVYGPDEPEHPNRVTNYLRRAATRRVHVLPGGGRAKRSLIYVDDVVRALIAAEARGGIGEEYLIAGEAVSQRDLLARVLKAGHRQGLRLSIPFPLVRSVATAADLVRRTPADCGRRAALRRLEASWRFNGEKTSHLLGVAPMTLDQGIQRTLDNTRSSTASRRAQLKRWETLASGLGDFSAAPTTRYYRRREQELISRFAGELAGQRILKLDLWNEAINTRILNWMRAQGALVTGLDWSHVVAHRARRNAQTEDGSPLRLVRGDIRELPFADASFDLAYTMGTIEHIDEYQTAVDELARVLRPGGLAIVGVPNRWDPFLRPLLVSMMERIGRYPYAPERSFGPSELRRVLERADLEVVARSGLLALPGFLRMFDLYLHTRGRTSRRLIPAILRPFESVEHRYEWFRRRGYLIAAVGQRP